MNKQNSQLGHHIGWSSQELSEYQDADLFSVYSRLAQNWRINDPMERFKGWYTPEAVCSLNRILDAGEEV